MRLLWPSMSHAVTAENDATAGDAAMAENVATVEDAVTAENIATAEDVVITGGCRNCGGCYNRRRRDAMIAPSRAGKAKSP